jgi:hypothetical protein
MPASTYTLEDIVKYARTDGKLDPLLSQAGFSQVKVFGIANDTITAMFAKPFNWKFNRVNVPTFFTISFQQDYASVNITNIGWLEHGAVRDINNASIPKPIFPIEVVRDLERTYSQLGRPGQVCWFPNNQLVQATWPGPNTVITNPVGAALTPANPIINILDTNGNIQVLTTYGTTGGTQPTWPAASSASGVTTNDGTVVWTVANPFGQGFRLGTLPAQSGVCWEVGLAAQAKPPKFTALTQPMDPITDEYIKYFRQGFVAHAYLASSDSKVNAMGENKRAAWEADMMKMVVQANRERDAAGFYPDRGIMSGAYPFPIGPAWPYGSSGF